MDNDLPDGVYREPISGGYRNIPLYFYVILAVAVISAGGIVYMFTRGNGVSNDPITQDSEVKNLVEKISSFLVLPTDEEPTVATVSDPKALKGQAFFDKAKKGDKVLIYGKAGKAILYDPIANKILEIAPININSQGSPPK